MKWNNASPTSSSPLIIWGMITLMVFLAACKHDPVWPDPDGQVQGNDTISQDTTQQNDTTGNDTTIVMHPCDPDTVYFERDLLPILVSNCALSGCHDANTAQDGVVLTSYDNVFQTGDIEPFRPDNSDLYEAITDTDPDKQMPPPPRSRLPDSVISMIQTWINQGAQNLTCDESTDCKTDNMSFSQDVQPILGPHCGGCHGSSNPSGGITLTTHAGTLGPAASGQLVGAISHSPGFSAMPQGGSKLSDCQISTIQAWIDQGSKDN